MDADTFAKRLMLSFFFVLLPCFLIAQVFEIDKQKDQRTIEDLAKQYPSVDATELKILLDKTSEELGQGKGQSAEIIGHVFMANKNADELDKLNPVSTDFFKKALLDARKLKRTDLELWASMHYGFYLYTYRKFEDSFPLFMYCIKILDHAAAEEIIQPGETYKKIAYFLMTAGDYEKANEYLHQARRYAKPNSSELASITDALGLNSLNNKDLSQAEQYFKEALVLAQASADKLRYAKALGNIAHVKFKQGDYNEAVRLLNQDIAISKKLGNTQNTIYALVMLGKVSIAKGNVADAKSNLKLAQKYAQSKTYFRSSDYEINKLILKIAKHTGDDKEELRARRNLEQLKGMLKGMDGSEAIMKIGWETKKNKLYSKIMEEKNKRQKESYIKIAAITACLVLLITIGFLIKVYRNRIKAEKYEYEEKMRILAKSPAVRLETQAFSRQILLDSHLMSKASWMDFKRFFIQTYPDYYQFLLRDFPGLTDSHLRIIFLTKLELDNVETARILGLTVDAVKKAKQRLRKKYGKEYDLLFLQNDLV